MGCRTKFMTPIKSCAELGAPDGLEVDLQGWHSEDKFFGKIIALAEPNVIVEVGTWKGASALHMAKLTDDELTHSRIYCVDTWLGGVDHMAHEEEPPNGLMRFHGYPQLFFQFLHNVKESGFADRIFPIVNSSLNGAKYLQLQNISADLIYVDGDHTYDGCYNDIVAFWNLLNPGGYMFGDDFSFPSVQHAVSRFAYERQTDMEVEGGNFWYFKKPNS